MAEEGLIEDVDAGREPSIQGVDGELSAAISARTSWRSSARSGRMALNRFGPPRPSR